MGTVDVLPTILDLLAIDAPAAVQGRSLVPLIDATAAADAERRRTYYAEALSPRLSHGWGELRVWLEGPLKYVHGPRPELYDVEADPHELDNLMASAPRRAAPMREHLEGYLAAHASAPTRAVRELDAATRDRLAALGYLSSSGDSPEELRETLRSDGPPPQDHVGDLNRVVRAKNHLSKREYLVAREVVALLRADVPDNAFYALLDAWALSGLGRFEEAFALLESLPEAPSGEGRLFYQLAARMAEAEPERALALVDKALAGGAGAQGYALRATIFRILGDEAEYVNGLRAALAVDASYLPARLELGITLAQRGAFPQAARELAAVLRQDPLHPRAHFNYARLLADLDRPEESKGHFERAVALA
ncbi:MAG: hypothetical protein GY797_10980, partial [Deltaproteobacteria bacterium]|nr:hypothetical protein [Deltaproteobacteria bacterium]